MKYAIIIPDGAADDPLPELDGRTPMEAAEKPAMDEIARVGRQGTVRTIPPGFESGSDVAIMSLLGYDPARYHTGRAPLEAAAQAIELGEQDWVFRCNLVTVVDDVMKDHSAGGITDAEAHRLLADLKHLIDVTGFEFYPGVSYRNLLVYRGNETIDVKTRPPHEILDEPIGRSLPRGRGADLLLSIMERSRQAFAEHEINVVRRQTGLNPATQVWLWGQGHASKLPSFVERFGVARGCMITGVDLLRGLAALLGWDVHEVPGMTSFHDTDYAAQGRETAAMLDRYDLVVSHIEAPDEASHLGDFKTKIESIESIDRHIVAPVFAKLRTFPQWRILVLPDHPTNIATRKHGHAPSPLAIAGTGIRPNIAAPYNERNAKNADLHIQHGHELMEYFLRGGGN
jgi:2,3-bisphosphoglycerate-independent phosphoglycerate mutase